jgi:hypothetical protein
MATLPAWRCSCSIAQKPRWRSGTTVAILPLPWPLRRVPWTASCCCWPTDPSSQPLDAALKALAARYKADPSDALRDCIKQLLALGAVSPDFETSQGLQPIIKECVQRSRLPHLINKAVVGALAHSGAERARKE